MHPERARETAPSPNTEGVRQLRRYANPEFNIAIFLTLLLAGGCLNRDLHAVDQVIGWTCNDGVARIDSAGDLYRGPEISSQSYAPKLNLAGLVHNGYLWSGGLIENRSARDEHRPHRDRNADMRLGVCSRH